MTLLAIFYVRLANLELWRNFAQLAMKQPLHARVMLQRNIEITRALFPTFLLRSLLILVVNVDIIIHFYAYPTALVEPVSYDSAFIEVSLNAVREGNLYTNHLQYLLSDILPYLFSVPIGTLMPLLLLATVPVLRKRSQKIFGA